MEAFFGGVCPDAAPAEVDDQGAPVDSAMGITARGTINTVDIFF